MVVEEVLGAHGERRYKVKSGRLIRLGKGHRKCSLEIYGQE